MVFAERARMRSKSFFGYPIIVACTIGLVCSWYRSFILISLGTSLNKRPNCIPTNVIRRRTEVGPQININVIRYSDIDRGPIAHRRNPNFLCLHVFQLIVQKKQHCKFSRYQPHFKVCEGIIWEACSVHGLVL